MYRILCAPSRFIEPAKRHPKEAVPESGLPGCSRRGPLSLYDMQATPTALTESVRDRRIKTMKSKGKPSMIASDEESCPCHGGTVPRFIQPMILMALAQSDAHGYEIMQRIAGMGLLRNGVPSEAGVYRVLKEMALRGLCASSWDTSGTGPAKNVYRLTPAGRECLSSWLGTIHDYRKFLGQLERCIKKALELT